MTSLAADHWPSLEQAPDDLRTRALRDLQRRLPSASWGPVQSLLWAGFSFGLLPLLVWPGKFRDFAAEESLQFRELAKWGRLRARRRIDGNSLLHSAERLNTRPILWVMGMLAMTYVIIAFAEPLARDSFPWDRLVEVTYRFSSHPHGSSGLRGSVLYRIWNAGLGAAYTLHWIQVRGRTSALRRFVVRFNAVSSDAGWALRWTHQPIELGPLWVGAAVVLASLGAWWGIPMALAGAAQRQYTARISPMVRGGLAECVRTAPLGGARDLSPRTSSIPRLARCPRPACRAPVPASARFCSRCGAATNEGVPA